MTLRPFKEWWMRPIVSRNSSCRGVGIYFGATMPEGLQISLHLWWVSIYITIVWGEWENAPVRVPSLDGGLTKQRSRR